jgi:hypothetical protein
VQTEVGIIGKEKFAALQKRPSLKINQIKQNYGMLKKRGINSIFETTKIEYVQIFIGSQELVPI